MKKLREQRPKIEKNMKTRFKSYNFIKKFQIKRRGNGKKTIVIIKKWKTN